MSPVTQVSSYLVRSGECITRTPVARPQTSNRWLRNTAMASKSSLLNTRLARNSCCKRAHKALDLIGTDARSPKLGGVSDKLSHRETLLNAAYTGLAGTLIDCSGERRNSMIKTAFVGLALLEMLSTAAQTPPLPATDVSSADIQAFINALPKDA